MSDDVAAVPPETESAVVEAFGNVEGVVLVAVNEGATFVPETVEMTT